MSKINCFVQIQESSDPFKPALDAVDQYEHVDRLVLKRVSPIKNEDEVFVEQKHVSKVEIPPERRCKVYLLFSATEKSPRLEERNAAQPDRGVPQRRNRGWGYSRKDMRESSNDFSLKLRTV